MVSKARKAFPRYWAVDKIRFNKFFVTVYNSMGQIILQQAIKTEKDLQLDLSKYGKGIYLIKVRQGDNESSSKVLVE